MQDISSQAPDRVAAPSPFNILGWLAASSLVILGAKFWLIQAFGATLPWWDEWAHHGMTYLQYFKTTISLRPDQIPLVEPTLSLKGLFTPHCEHRLVVTRLYALLLLVLNGQWDARLETVVNALLHTFTGIALALMFWKLADRKFLPLLCIVTTMIFGLPFSWEATLWGICNSYYALLAFALGALWLMIVHRPGSILWFSGLLCAVTDLLAMGSGLITPLAILMVGTLRWVKDRAQRLATAWLILASLAVLILGVLLIVPVTGNAPIQAQRLTDLLAGIAQRCTWPNSRYLWLALLAWLPFLVLAIRYLLIRGKRPGAEEFALGLGLWILLQIAAIAFGRYGAGIASRHTVILSLGILLNFFCAVLLWQAHARAGWPRIFWTAILGLWLCQFIPGLWSLSRQAVYAEAPLQKYYFTQSEQNVRAFIQSDDLASLQGKPQFEVPYPDVVNLAALLRVPAIRRILPAEINPTPFKGSLSRAAEWLAAAGQYIFWIGLALMPALLATSIGKRFKLRC
ncbi:MAG: hypothetical protein HYV35_09265 [Lentisphaerae bacterium]|nr:hypothetical protein [Lentisphaerota bacterium]